MRNWGLYVLLLPTLLYAAIFLYWPMYGILIAFKDYKAPLGILGSPWTDQHGLKYFLQFFSSYSFEEIVGNTLRISVYYLLVSTPIPIAFALLLNYIERPGFKKVVQTVTYAPHFISTVVMCGMLFLLLAPTSGITNKMLIALGGRSVFSLHSPEWFPHVYVWSGIWQNVGWNTIIYTAALSGVDPELHEAAQIDGASRFRRVLYIDLPTIMATVTIMLILNAGNIMSIGFEKVYLMQTDLNLAASEIISTYVYKVSFVQGSDFSYASAIGLFNSVINMALLVTVNAVSRKVSESSLW